MYFISTTTDKEEIFLILVFEQQLQTFGLKQASRNLEAGIIHVHSVILILCNDLFMHHKHSQITTIYYCESRRTVTTWWLVCLCL